LSATAAAAPFNVGRQREAYMIKYQIGVLPSKASKWQYKEDISNTAEDAWNKAKELYDQHINDNSYVQIKINKIVR
jgi:hypothetical protein